MQHDRPLGTERRASTLGKYLYFLLRLLDIECAWLVNTSSFEWKNALAENIGFCGFAINALNGRRKELNGREEFPHASLALENELRVAASIHSITEQERFVAEANLKLKEALEVELGVLPLHDEPSRNILQHILDQTSRQGKRTKLSWKFFSHSPFQEINGSGAVVYSKHLPIPSLSSEPGRPELLRKCDDNILQHRTEWELILNDDCMRRFLHFICVDIEVCAAEVCAQNVVLFREMPFGFKADMARQVADEMRHFLLIKPMLEKFDGKIGQYTYSAGVFRRCAEGIDLSERLAIQQVIQEGDAIESNIKISKLFNTVGYYEDAAIFEFINADEVNHVSFGNRWLLALADNKIEIYLAVVKRAVEKVGSFPGKRGFSTSVRTQAGFPPEFFSEFPSFEID